MAIAPPNWKKDALPTARGWAHPRTGEILKSQKISEADINEYLGVPEAPVIVALLITIEPFTITSTPLPSHPSPQESVMLRVKSQGCVLLD